MTENEKKPKNDSQLFSEQSNWALIKRMLGLAWEYRYGCLKVLILQIFLLSLGIFGLGMMGLGVDYIRYELARASFQEAHMSPSDETPSQPLDEAVSNAKPPRWPFGISPPEHWSRMHVLALISLSILLMAIIRAILDYTNTVETNRLVQARIVVHLRSKVFAKMQKLSFRFFDANASGSLINRVTGDVQAVRMFIDGVVLMVITVMISLVIYVIYMARIHSMLTLVCLASTPMLWILAARFSRTVRPAYAENRDRFDKLILALSENIQGVHVVKGFARQPEQIGKYKTMNDGFSDHQSWIFRQVSFFQPLILFITHINIIAMIVYGGFLVVRFEQAPDPAAAAAAGISVGQLLVFAGLLQHFSGQVGNITNIANSIQQSLTGAQRVFELLDAPVEIESPTTPAAMTKCQGKLQFENVSFGYNPNELVIEDISFSLESGETAAILGQTGSGKSTLMSLVPRFYDPTQGKILLDDIDLRQLDLDTLRRNIGLVFQESFLFSNTVAANIAFGHPEASMDQIIKASKIAKAHDFITALPKGYDTILHEGGSNLSGGQRQRIAIARAILLEPPILIMDDPTAAIDPETEKEIMEAMESAMEGRTTLIVAHRLSTLRRAHKVIVLNKGKIIQSGTHDELMQTQGHYRWAARLQIPDKISLDLLNEDNDHA